MSVGCLLQILRLVQYPRTERMRGQECSEKHHIWAEKRTFKLRPSLFQDVVQRSARRIDYLTLEHGTNKL